MKYLLSLLVIGCLALGSVEAKADGPDKGFGIGIETGEIFGAMAFYQITSMIQLGSGLGLQIKENTAFYISPQARFLFNVGMAATYLMLDAQVRLLFGDSSQSALVVRLGLMHWLSAMFSVYGGVNMLELEFDPSRTTFGILGAFVGLQIMLTSG